MQAKIQSGCSLYSLYKQANGKALHERLVQRYRVGRCIRLDYDHNLHIALSGTTDQSGCTCALNRAPVSPEGNDRLHTGGFHAETN